MGRFLTIGAATFIEADKEEAKKKFSSMDLFREALLRRFNANGIYDVEEDESKIRLRLNDNVGREEWIPFLKAFFELRYGPNSCFWRDIEKELSKHGNLKEWLAAADNGGMCYYQSDGLRWYPFNGEKEWNATTVSVNYIALSLAGKIAMEFYYDMFAFFTRLLRDRLSQYRLADSLLVHITE
jgi:hypothetical protein